MSLRGGEAEDVDVSTVTEFPVDPQIDLTETPTMTPSAWLFQNLHASVDIFVTDDKTKGEIRIRAGRELGLDSRSRRWWARAQAEDADVKLGWSAK